LFEYIYQEEISVTETLPGTKLIDGFPLPLVEGWQASLIEMFVNMELETIFGLSGESLTRTLPGGGTVTFNTYLEKYIQIITEYNVENRPNVGYCTYHFSDIYTLDQQVRVVVQEAQLIPVKTQDRITQEVVLVDIKKDPSLVTIYCPD